MAEAVVCFAVGISAGLLGSLLTVISWLLGAEAHPWLRGCGTAFLIVIIPSLILAGYCLDKTDKLQNGTGKRGAGERGSVLASFVVTVTVGFGFLLLAPAEFKAQQTIFNVPTTDVLDKGKVYAELDVSLKPNGGSEVTKFSSFVPRVVIGVGNRVELGLNLTGNIQPGSDSTTFVPTIKWKPYQGRDKGWTFVIGNNLFIPVRNRGYNAGNYVYAAFSKNVQERDSTYLR